MATTGRDTRSKPHWKTAALGTALGAAIVGAIMLTSALAVDGSPFPFEVDGNVTNTSGVFGPPPSGDGRDDWQNVFELDGITPPATGTPVASGAEVFIHDIPAGSAKETQYDAGKDNLDLDDWTRKEVSKVVPDKDNITNAYAKQYLIDHDADVTTPEHRVIYFGMDRFANNGDAALGFWFFQNQVQLTGTNGFSPNHTAFNPNTGQRGDILVQVDFINGGAQSRIEVFEWVGTGGDTGGGTLQKLREALSNGVTVCTTDDAACATANATTTGSYWPYVPKFGTSGRFPPQSFFEGGIDISVLVGDVCFNSFLANTRTSHSETADLKDLALGDFNTCGSIDLVRKECQADEELGSPSYNATTEKYQSKHVLTILNDGLGGNVFDVKIRDDAVDADNTCTIVDIDGGTGGYPTLPYAIPNNTTFVQVADQLAAGVANQMTVTLICQSPLNGFVNSATIQAGQTDGGTSLTDSYAEQFEPDVSPQCVLNFSPELVLTKTCDDVTLDPNDGFKPKVCVDISITNNSAPAQRLDIDTFIDERLDGSTADLIENIPLSDAGHPGVFHRQLEPGQTINILNECYTPTAPDADQTDPDLARYTDQISATATGHAGGSTGLVSSLPATCDLCPIGLDGTN